MRPPICSTISLQIDSPKPVPCTEMLRAARAVKRLEQLAYLIGGDAAAAVVHR